MESGEIFTKKSKKKSSLVLVIWSFAFLLVMTLVAWSYFQFQQQPNESYNSSTSTSEQLALDLQKVEIAKQYNSLLKSLSVNIDSEVASVDTPIRVEKTKQGFVVTNRLQLAFFNHSEQYIQISNILPNIAKQSDHTYDVDISLAEQQSKNIVLPPLGKMTTELFFTTTAECLLKSYAVSWQYNYSIDEPSLDFIFQGNDELRKQAEPALSNTGFSSQVIVNHSDLKSIQEQVEDFCQYEL